MKPNIELMKRLRTRFLRMRHPKHFKMTVIAVQSECGTAMCVAGHTLDLAGYKRRLRPESQRNRLLDYDYLYPSGRKIDDPLAVAAKELGLKYTASMESPANKLFHDWSLKTPEDAAGRIGQLIEEYQQ